MICFESKTKFTLTGISSVDALRPSRNAALTASTPS
jgi:hypothetical protein